MADAAQSKKRGAVRQITKDDDLDLEEEEGDQGTFKKASAEVMATRRIVKVRKTQQPKELPNPFASIQLVAPTVPSATQASEQKAEDAKDKLNGKGAEEKDKLNGKEAEGKENKLEAEEKTNKQEAEEKENTEEKDRLSRKEPEDVVENGDKEEGGEKAVVEDTKLHSFQQVSSTANAFGTFASALSSSSFTFGIAASSSSATTSSFTFGSSSTSFGGFGTAAAGSASGGFSLFNQDAESSSPSAPPQPSHATVTLQEVPTETGEEQEKAEFTGDSILYEFVDKAWKERGKGELRLNISQDGDKKPRLVMRSKGNLRLLLNANLFPDMMLKKMENKSVTFACINSAAGKEAPTLTTYAVKLRDPSLVTGFIEKVEAHKGTKTESSKTEEASESEKAKEDKAPVAAADEAASAVATEEKNAQQV